MKNTIQYKGYTGTVEYSDTDCLLFGKVLGIKGLVSYEGHSVAELKEDFECAVDDYLEMCKSMNITPEKVYKGSFNVRLDPELHKRACIIAQSEHISLNQFVEMSVREKVQAIYK